MANRKIVLDKLQREILQSIDGNPSQIQAQEFYYTGTSQLYSVPKTGYYKILLQGAGTWSSKGGSTSGIIYLNQGQNLYFFVGEAGAFNASVTGATFGYGGGATDVRLVDGPWDNPVSLKSRIMVAGGGGGTDYSLSVSTSGGGLATSATYKNAWPLKFIDKSVLVKGATQEMGGIVASAEGHNGTFGRANPDATSPDYGGVGGGGYYGGASLDGHGAATGGSSFISGYAGSNAIESASSLTPTNQVRHYSGLYFLDGKMGIGTNRLTVGVARIEYVGDTKPERVNFSLDAVRYIKDCVGQNSINKWNHFGELQVIKDGINIAKGKIVTGDALESTASSITDGKIDTYSEASGTNSCITLDLGKSESVDEIAIWHYYQDNRQYFNHTLSVSPNNKNYTVIHNQSPHETSLGIRVSAYSTSPILSSSLSASSMGHILKEDKEIKDSLKQEENTMYITGKNLDNYIWYMGILWRAYALSDNEVSLISDEIVGIDQFYTKTGANDYKNSLVRKWLNDYFYAQLPYGTKKDVLLHDFCIDMTSDANTTDLNCHTSVYDSVGLLTLAEYNFIGGANSYLNNNYNFWTQTGKDSTSNIFMISNGSVSTWTADGAAGIRPVIHVSADTEIYGGKGTLQEPYLLDGTPNKALRGEFGIYFEYNQIKWRLVDAECIRNGNTCVNGVKAIYADSNDKLPSYAFETASITNGAVYTPNRSTNIASKIQSFAVSKNQLISPNLRLGFQDYDYCVGSIDCALRGYKTDVTVNSDNYTTPVTSTIFLPIQGEIFTGFDSYNHYDSYWTMTPRTGGEYAWRVMNSGEATSASAYSLKDVLKARPVIFFKWELPLDCSGSRNGTYQHPCLVAT